MPTDKKETGAMTHADEIAELRRWLRSDAKELHKKIDDHAKENVSAHALLNKRLNEIHAGTTDKINAATKDAAVEIAAIDKKTAVIATKVGIVVTGITSVVLSIIHKFFLE